MADNDVFPEQFENFLGMSVGLKALFMEHHRDLLSAAYWREVQEKIETSGALPFSPYAQASRAQA